jgi:Protein of unknown function (DUF1566)/Divergent InlB B-repeat domain/PKD domain
LIFLLKVQNFTALNPKYQVVAIPQYQQCTEEIKMKPRNLLRTISLPLCLLSTSVLITPVVEAASNQKPIANAGIDQVVGTSTAVILDGSQSYDPDGSVKRYQWFQSKGTRVTLTGNLTAKPSFKSPATSGTLIFNLTVLDNKSAIARDTVTVTVAALPVLNVVKVGNGNGTIKNSSADINCGVTCSASFAIGTTVNLTAVPANGSIFIGWSDACAGTGTCSVTMNQAQKVSAEFAQVLQPPILGKLNDTGIVTCSNDTSNGKPCPLASYPGQDADSGRDVTKNDNSDGHAGFSFTKISSTGAILSISNTSWSCIRDNVTGLMWEEKTNDNGLHDQHWTYTWYEPDTTKNGGQIGKQNGGSCGNTSQCDTYAYVQAVNATVGWCGVNANKWRLPTVDELSGIAALDRVNPAIDTTYFPDTSPAFYWSATPDAGVSYGAMIVDFNSGRDSSDYKSYGNQVRLVRSGQ